MNILNYYFVKFFLHLKLLFPHFKRVALKLFCLIAVIVAGFYSIWNPAWPEGDELHYFVMTESFIKDWDFDLENNYQSKEYLRYRPSEVRPHILVSPKDSKHRSWHNILLPILISPGFFLLSSSGGRLMLFILNILGLYVIYKILREIYNLSLNISLFSVSIFLLSYPIINHFHIVYPDLLAGNFLVAGFYSFFRSRKSKNFKLHWSFLSAVIFSLVMFLHYKLIIALPIVYFFMILTEIFYDQPASAKNLSKAYQLTKAYVFKNATEIICVGTIWLIFVGLYSYTMFRWFGSFNPNAPFFLLYQNTPKLNGNPLLSLLGMLFDANYGLLVLAPILSLIIPGLFIWQKKFPKNFYLQAVPILILIFFQLNYHVWRTWSPPARYLMAFLPSLIPALALAFEWFFKEKFGKILIFLVSILNLAITETLYHTRRAGYPLPGGKINEPMLHFARKFPLLGRFEFLFLDLYNNNQIHYYIAGIWFISLVLFGWAIVKYPDFKIKNSKKTYSAR